jgi:hypothetical protein
LALQPVSHPIKVSVAVETDSTAFTTALLLFKFEMFELNGAVEEVGEASAGAAATGCCGGSDDDGGVAECSWSADWHTMSRTVFGA